MYWSSPIPFGWYFNREWEYKYGRNWAFEICQEWYDYDGRRDNLGFELEPKSNKSHFFVIKNFYL
jgi:hypothetical protein